MQLTKKEAEELRGIIRRTLELHPDLDLEVAKDREFIVTAIMATIEATADAG